MEPTRSETWATRSDGSATRLARRCLVGVLIAGAMAAPARAEFVTSDQLYDWLFESIRRGGSFKDATLSLGFVTGVHDLMAEGEVCAPAKTSGKTLQAAVFRWMKANDTQWDPVAARTVRRALAESFPCNGSTTR